MVVVVLRGLRGLPVPLPAGHDVGQHLLQQDAALRGAQHLVDGVAPGRVLQSQSQIIYLAIGCYIRRLNITECLAQLNINF